MVYIAYKFTNTPDKSELTKTLTTIATVVHALGKQTFLLLRDVQNWGKAPTTKLHTLSVIVPQMLRAKTVVALVTHDKPSIGLFIEMLIATILGKHIVLVTKKGLQKNYIRHLASEVVEFPNLTALPKLLRAIVWS